MYIVLPTTMSVKTIQYNNGTLRKTTGICTIAESI